MNEILLEYLEVIKIPKWERKKRNKLLNNWNLKEFLELPTYEELKEFEFYCKNNNLIYDSYFFENHIISPIYYKEIFENKNFSALMNIYENKGRSYFSNCENEEIIDLLFIGLKFKPNNITLLKDKHKNYLTWFDYYIHEIPWAVLYSSDSASLAEIILMQKELKEFESFCLEKKLELPTQKIECYKFYFKTWELYLNNDLEYEKLNYEDYLVKYELKTWIQIMKNEIEESNSYSHEFYVKKYSE